MRSYKKMYKLITSPELKSVTGILKGNTFIPIDEENRHYQRFIQDIAEQSIEIVEGPDVVEPSYAELRAAEYPSREEQFDMMYWDKVNGTTVWENTIQTIKDKYPKSITGGTTIASVPTWVQEAADNWTYNKQLRDYINAVAILESDPDEETRDAAQAIIDTTPNSIIDSINN